MQVFGDILGVRRCAGDGSEIDLLCADELIGTLINSNLHVAQMFVDMANSQFNLAKQSTSPNSDLDDAKALIQELMDVLHPGVVGLIINHHGEVAQSKAIEVMNKALVFMRDGVSSFTVPTFEPVQDVEPIQYVVIGEASELDFDFHGFKGKSSGLMFEQCIPVSLPEVLKFSCMLRVGGKYGQTQIGKLVFDVTEDSPSAGMYAIVVKHNAGETVALECLTNSSLDEVKKRASSCVKDGTWQIARIEPICMIPKPWELLNLDAVSYLGHETDFSCFPEWSWLVENASFKSAKPDRLPEVRFNVLWDVVNADAVWRPDVDRDLILSVKCSKDVAMPDVYRDAFLMAEYFNVEWVRFHI